jgi:RimJ/RimL family protein N-acetyltransferase
MVFLVYYDSLQITQGLGKVMDLKFRIATIADADLLFQWRNDPETREQIHNTDVLKYDDHVAWLKASLLNPQREIRIAELSGVPVGTIRLDKAGNACELSWTVAPQARGSGIGKAILKTTLDNLNMPARAEIKSGNEASKRMVEYAGMTLEREENGTLYYRK